MSGSRRASDDAAALLLGRALAMVAEAGLMLVVVRLLGKAEVGALAGMLVMCQTIAIVGTVGLPASLLMALPGQPDSTRRAIAEVHMRLLHGLGAVAGCCVVAFAMLADDEPDAALAWICLAPLPIFDLPMRALPNLLLLEGHAAAGARLAIAKAIVASASTLVPVALGAPLWAVAASTTLGAALAWTAVPWAMVALYRGAARARTPGAWATLRGALPLGVTDIAGAIAARLDRHLVLAWFSAEAFAEYQIGAWQIPFIVNIPYAVGTAAAAPMRERFLAGQGPAAVALWRDSIREVGLVVVPVSMVFFVAAPAVVELLFTPRYLPAVPVFRCYTLLTMARVAAFGVVLVAAGRSRDVLWSATFGLAAAVVVSIPLTAVLGPIGAAIAAMIAFVPSVAFYCWRIAIAAGISIRQTFPLGAYLRLVAWAAIPGGAAHVVIVALEPTPVGAVVLTTAVVCVGFTALATHAGALTRAHWRFLSRWLSLAPLRRG